MGRVDLTSLKQGARIQFSLVYSVVSDSLQPHGLQHARPPCPSPTPGIYSNSCLLSWWCHPIISSFVVPFPSCLQSFPASGSFQMSQFFQSGGQSVGVSASASVLLMNIQDLFPLGWTGWSPCSPRDSQESFPIPQDGQVMVERSDRMWSTGERNGKPLQYSCLENAMDSMKNASAEFINFILLWIYSFYKTSWTWNVKCCS